MMLDGFLDMRLMIAIAFCLVGISLLSFGIWRRRKSAHRFGGTFVGFGVFGIVSALYVLEPYVQAWLGITPEYKIPYHIIDVIWWVALGFLFTRLIDAVLWRGLLTHHGELLIPRVLVHLTNFFIYFAILICFLYFAVGKDVSGLVTTSGVLVVALGYLAKRPFESAFAGLALNLAPMFKKGDRVAIYVKDIEKEFMGTVLDIGWMHVTIRNKEGHFEHIQNLLVEDSAVVNFSQPHQHPCYTTEVTLEYEVPMHQAYKAINDAMHELDDMIEEFNVFAERFSRFGITYAVRFWSSDKHPYHDVVQAIHSAIYYKVQKDSHWDFGYDKFNSMNAAQVSDKAFSVHQAATTALTLTTAQRAALLRKVEIFASLNEDEVNELAKTCVPRTFGPPEKIIHQGETGDSMFVVIEGRVQVYLQPESHEIIELTVNGPGKYFGEMALLTGQPRGANVKALEDVVLLEIPKEGLSKILKNRPSLAGTIATAVADRQAQNEALLSAVSEKSKSGQAQSKTLAESIRLKVHHFFGLDVHSGSSH